jgi:hypothetical protein
MSSWTAKQQKGQLVFQSGKTQLAWTEAGNKLMLNGLRDGGKGFGFGEGSALWRIQLRDREGTRVDIDSSDRAAFSYRTAGSSLMLTWKGLAAGTVDVVVKVTADKDAPILRCRMQVDLTRSAYTAWEILFPVLTDVLGPTGSHRDDVLLTTDGFGSAIPDPIRQPKLTAWTNSGYPNGLQTMPYVALTNGGLGLYLGAHDPAAGLCRFRNLPDKEKDRQPLSVLIEPENAGRLQGRLTVQQEIVLGIFRGDWYDASLIYRAWALKQRWAAQTVEQRKDIPAWSRAMPLWVRLGIKDKPSAPGQMDAERQLDVTLRFQAMLGRPCAVHLYTWHRFPFDTFYPDYRPSPGMKRFVKRLQDAGARVMPYINARLFDLDHPDWVRDGAERFAAKGASPKVGGRAERLFSETYDSGQPMEVMCAATPYWQNKIAGTVARLVEDLGVDGVYVDQVAAAPSAACSDPSHGHPLRGGGWWIEGYAEMMRKTWQLLRRKGLDKETLLTTECNADPYLDMFGNFLMLHAVRSGVVPMFSAVYGGRVPMFARQTNPAEGVAFRISTGQSILWGCQNGWLDLAGMELLMNPKHQGELAYLRGLCELFDRMLPFFDGGEMLRPPVLEGNIQKAHVVWDFCMKWPEDIETVWTARWRRGRRSVVGGFNAHGKRQQVRIPLTREEAAAGAPSVWWASNTEEGSIKPGKTGVTLDLPAGSIFLLQFGGRK